MLTASHRVLLIFDEQYYLSNEHKIPKATQFLHHTVQ